MSVVAVVYGVNEALLKRSQAMHAGHVDEVILAKDDRTGLMNAWRRPSAITGPGASIPSPACRTWFSKCSTTGGAMQISVTNSGWSPRSF